jgi:predicted ATPase
MVGHRLMGSSLMLAGQIAEGRAHFEWANALYNPADHRPLATRFGQDVGVTISSYRSLAWWLLGYPKAALTDAEHALKDAREIGHAATLMFALGNTLATHIWCGNYATANAMADELVALADEKGSLSWKRSGMITQGSLLALTGKASDAVQMIGSGLAAWRATGATAGVPRHLSFLAWVHAQLGQFDDAWRCIGEAMTVVETTKETMHEADILRMAGEIALMSPEPDAAKAEAYFERALQHLALTNFVALTPHASRAPPPSPAVMPVLIQSSTGRTALIGQMILRYQCWRSSNIHTIRWRCRE